jgi:hypothetical protein
MSAARLSQIMKYGLTVTYLIIDQLTPNKCTETSLSLISLLKDYPNAHFGTSLLPLSGGSLMFVHRPMFLGYIRTVESVFVITTLYKIV